MSLRDIPKALGKGEVSNMSLSLVSFEAHRGDFKEGDWICLVPTAEMTRGHANLDTATKLDHA